MKDLILAANSLAEALFADFDRFPPRRWNQTRWMFLDPHARSRFADRHEQARAAVENLRFEVGRDPDDRATLDRATLGLVAEPRSTAGP